MRFLFSVTSQLRNASPALIISLRFSSPMTADQKHSPSHPQAWRRTNRGGGQMEHGSLRLGLVLAVAFVVIAVVVAEEILARSVSFSYVPYHQK